MTLLKSAQHHWWPVCVSRHWADGNGNATRIEPSGRMVSIPTHLLGRIGNGHYGKLSATRGAKSTYWDFSVEQEFDAADTQFPEVIRALSVLKPDTVAANDQQRFCPQRSTDDLIRAIIECTVSLAIRSPMNRDAFATLAGRFGPPVTSADLNVIISANLRGKQRRITDDFGARGKYAVLFSERREFIFGDGFFTNLSGMVDARFNPKLIVPLTPTMAVIVCRPIEYMSEPRLSSTFLSDGEVQQLNSAVQVYSKSELFFRSHAPELDSAFVAEQRYQYTNTHNPMDDLIRSIPGMR